MKNKSSWIIGGLLALVGLPASAATVYTWTGADGATDATWENPLNWAGGTAPNGVAGQLSTNSSTDQVIFNSETASFMPSNSILTRNSFTGSFKNPQIQVLNGQVNFTNNLNWGWSGISTFIVGDGNMTTLAVANTGYTELNRDPGGMKTYVVNADGTLIFRNNVGNWSNDGSSKKAAVSLVGGTVRFDGTITSKFTDATDNYVSFDAIGATFKAKIGGQLATSTNIQDAIDVNNSLRLGGSLNSGNAALQVTDDGTSWTITAVAIPEPSAALLGGLGVLALLRRRRC